jgi:uncharacterized membrane protein
MIAALPMTTRWAMAHGALTHFPIALVLCSGALDGAGFALAGRPVVRELHAAGYWTMLLAALGSAGAVASGLLLTRGGVLGHGLIRWHHLFAWPAFALLIALATWRASVGRRATRGAFAGYLAGVALAAGLVSIAGYWGGELLLNS